MDVDVAAEAATTVVAPAMRQRGNLKEAEKHALATAHLPGIMANHTLQPYDISQLAEDEVVAMHQHQAFSHLTREEMMALISRYGPNDAAHAADAIRSHREAQVKRGVDISRMPLWLPITRLEDVNPLTTVLSMEQAMPWDGDILPVMYEHLQDVLQREGASIEHMLLALPYLPMAMAPGALPHVLFRKPFPPVMNSFMWIRHLLAVIKKCQDDCTMLEEHVVHALYEQHRTRWATVDQSFETETDALLAKHKAYGQPEVSDVLLLELESICSKHQLNFIRCLELSAAAFYLAENQPKRRVRVTGPKDMKITDPAQLQYHDTPPNTGIPANAAGSLYCFMMMCPLDKARREIREEIVQEIRGVLRAREVMRYGDSVTEREWTYVRSNATLELVSHYASFPQLRQHWDQVFDEAPLGEYAWYKSETSHYEQALQQATASTDATNGQLIVTQPDGYSDMPPLVSGTLSDLPTGGLVDQQNE